MLSDQIDQSHLEHGLTRNQCRASGARYDVEVSGVKPFEICSFRGFRLVKIDTRQKSGSKEELSTCLRCRNPRARPTPRIELE